MIGAINIRITTAEIVNITNKRVLNLTVKILIILRENSQKNEFISINKVYLSRFRFLWSEIISLIHTFWELLIAYW